MMNWHNQSLNFQKLADLVPGGIFFDEKSTMVLGVQNLSKIVLG
jgi:hypothetical protein